MSMTSRFDVCGLIADIENDWKDILEILVIPFESHINDALSEEDQDEISPSRSNTFAAFKACSFVDLKVVIIGQDCYHQTGQATGLCFSVRRSTTCPPSLRNIFKEIEREYKVKRTDTDLTDWAQQGVLLLNTALTVREGHPGSHIKVWRDFTREIVKYIAANKQDVVYMLWGDFAISFAQYINATKNCVLTHSHPSPLARKPFTGNSHFTRCNTYLKQKGKDEILWV